MSVNNSQIPYFKAWIIFYLATLLLSFLCGMAIGAALGAGLAIVGAPVQTIQIVGGIAGFVLSLVISFVMFRWVVDKYIVPSVASTAASPVV
jgi:hypothetical protein